MACATLGPIPPIRVEAIISQEPNFSLSQMSTLPAKFSASLIVVIDLRGGKPASDVEVTVEAFMIPDAGDSDYLRSFARPAAELDINEPTLSAASRLVRVGRYTVQTRTEESLPPGAI